MGGCPPATRAGQTEGIGAHSSTITQLRATKCFGIMIFEEWCSVSPTRKILNPDYTHIRITCVASKILYAQDPCTEIFSLSWSVMVNLGCFLKSPPDHFNVQPGVQ